KSRAWCLKSCSASCLVLTGGCCLRRSRPANRRRPKGCSPSTLRSGARGDAGVADEDPATSHTRPHAGPTAPVHRQRRERGFLMTRLTVAMLGVLAALIGHDAHSPTVVVIGLAAVVPLLTRLLTLPVGTRRAGFWLSAVVAGLVLAGCAAHHDSS